MPKLTLRVFDPNITLNSPAGSCLLKMLQAAVEDDYTLDLFTIRTDLEASASIRIRSMPAPMKPVFVQSILFSLTAVFFNLTSRPKTKTIRISTQGGFPFCDISYAHCCHKLFLNRYRSQISGRFFTRTARFINHRWSAALEAIAFLRASIIVVPSQGLADELLSAYGHAIQPKVHIIANPVDCEKFTPEVPPTSDYRPFTFAFCALGNFDWKGLGLVIQAMATGVPGALKVIGGKPSEIARFQTLARSLAVNQRIEFVGLQKDIRPYLWTSDVFVFPSVYETFPLVCLQAAAAGLPLIATNLYGLEHLLQPGISGWRVERSVQSVANAMHEAIADKCKSAAMGREARRLAANYDTQEFQKSWLALLVRAEQAIACPVSETANL